MADYTVKDIDISVHVLLSRTWITDSHIPDWPTNPYIVDKMTLILTILFLFHFTAVSKTRTQQDIFFDPAPFGKNVAEGEETRLRCDVSARQHIAFYWTLDDKPVQNNSRRFQEDSDLRILRVNREVDSGEFRCIATNTTTGVSIRSVAAVLNIFCKYFIPLTPLS